MIIFWDPEQPWYAAFVIVGIAVLFVVALMMWEFSQWSDESWYDQ